MVRQFVLSFFVFVVVLIALPSSLLATHNRAGEISIEQVGDCVSSLTVKATIVTYSKASSFQADRDSLEICWGDGQCEYVYRINGPISGGYHKGERLENDTKKNIYVAFHTFPALGTYNVSMTDPNRNGGILNVNFSSKNNRKIEKSISAVHMDYFYDKLSEIILEIFDNSKPFIENSDLI